MLFAAQGYRRVNSLKIKIELTFMMAETSDNMVPILAGLIATQ
jgi:hypothetical protein